MERCAMEFFSSVALARNKTHFPSDVRNLNAHSSLMHIHVHVFRSELHVLKIYTYVANAVLNLTP